MRLDLSAKDWNMIWPLWLAVVHGAPTDVDDPSEDPPMCLVTVMSGLEMCDGNLALQVSWHATASHHRKHGLRIAP
jgi:hypothetical protein